MWLIPTFFAIHNAEEAVAFARMRASGKPVAPVWLGDLDAQLSTAVLVQALAIVSVLAFILAGFVVLRPRVRVAVWLLLSLEAAIAINVVAHIASALAFFHGYGPGLASAVLVNAPFAVYVLRRAKREEWVSRGGWQTLAVGGLVLHGSALMAVLWLAVWRPR